MNIQWFPGHMTRARREIEASVKLVDVVVELRDARVPRSSGNPDIGSLTHNKPRIIALNKSDMADPAQNNEWTALFALSGITAIPVDSISGKGLADVIKSVRALLSDKINRHLEKGMTKTVRMMVLGVPNVGKSSFINKLAKRAGAKVGDRPGVTRGRQWIKIDSSLELLDTPGILWSKFDDADVGLHLAYTGAIRDDIIDIEELACNFIGEIRGGYKENLMSRYKLSDIDGLSDYEVLLQIARNRGFLAGRGEFDTRRGAIILFDEFRSMKLGRITLEKAK